MRQLVHSELLKIRTLRAYWWLALTLLLGVPVLIAVNIVTVGDVPGRLNTSEGVRNVFSGASPPVMLIMGIMLVAGEFRHGTATATFLASPIRSRVLAAKLIAAALLGRCWPYRPLRWRSGSASRGSTRSTSTWQRTWMTSQWLWPEVSAPSCSTPSLGWGLARSSATRPSRSPPR